jgi:hypothetical protein
MVRNYALKKTTKFFNILKHFMKNHRGVEMKVCNLKRTCRKVRMAYYFILWTLRKETVKKIDGFIKKIRPLQGEYCELFESFLLMNVHIECGLREYKADFLKASMNV